MCGFNDFLFIFKGLCLSYATFRDQEYARESGLAVGVSARPGGERGQLKGTSHAGMAAVQSRLTP